MQSAAIWSSTIRLWQIRNERPGQVGKLLMLSATGGVSPPCLHAGLSAPGEPSPVPGSLLVRPLCCPGVLSGPCCKPIRRETESTSGKGEVIYGPAVGIEHRGDLVKCCWQKTARESRLWSVPNRPIRGVSCLRGFLHTLIGLLGKGVVKHAVQWISIPGVLFL